MRQSWAEGLSVDAVVPPVGGLVSSLGKSSKVGSL